MKRYTSLVLVLALSSLPLEAASAPNIPTWAQSIFDSKLGSKYRVHAWVSPGSLTGDFNGDGERDIAVLVEKKDSKKRGIAVIHTGIGTASILGAGRPIGNGGDDFAWMDTWSVEKWSPSEDESAKQDSLYVAKSESAGGIIYWDGTRYDWSQSGD